MDDPEAREVHHICALMDDEAVISAKETGSSDEQDANSANESGSCTSCLRQVLLQACCCDVVWTFGASALCVLLVYHSIRAAVPKEYFWALVLNYQIFAVFAMLHASYTCFRHMIRMYKANTRDATILCCTFRILLMVPVYAVDASIAFVLAGYHHPWTRLLGWWREVYEAIVLVSFVHYVTMLWGGPLKMAQTMSYEEVQHPFFTRPFFRRLAPGSDFLARTTTMIVQYAYVMLLVVCINFAMWLWMFEGAPWEAAHSHSKERYHSFLNSTVAHLPGIGPSLSEKMAHVSPFSFTNVLLKMPSNGLAMYHLILLYEHLINNEHTKGVLEQKRPLNKVLAIKFIVMLTLWQEMIIKFLANMDLMPRTIVGLHLMHVGHDATEPYTWNREQVAEGLVNFLLCIEMLFFAAWHRFAYPVREQYFGVSPCQKKRSYKFGVILQSVLLEGPGLLDLKDIRELRKYASQQHMAKTKFSAICRKEYGEHDTSEFREKLSEVFRAFASSDEGDDDNSEDDDDNSDEDDLVSSSPPRGQITQAQMIYLLDEEVSHDATIHEKSCLDFQGFYAACVKHMHSGFEDDSDC